MSQGVRILGIDPGLRHTGWGLVGSEGSRLRYIACGRIATIVEGEMAQRLSMLADALDAILDEHAPDEAAVEETFVNTNPRSALKLGQARGICLLAPARRGLPVAEYAANQVKKSVVGAGHADKTQIAAMVARLLPGSRAASADAADALAIAVTHAMHRPSQRLKSQAAANLNTIRGACG
ncbi:MAG: crossover junction endodeoxyribonuclease RuvC [Pseudomonadota bacterium]